MTSSTTGHSVKSREGSAPLLEVQDLAVSLGGNELLSQVSLSVHAGELLGLVGESGSGKTLTGLSILGLLPADARVSGSVRFGGQEILGSSARQLREVRGRDISMIFQEPRASLHPARPIGKQIVDVLRAHEGISMTQARARAMEMLGLVGLSNPKRTMKSYTHELSGGMCQRVMIAMALVCGPRLLIADEPTTALDVTIQAQVMALLSRLAAELDLAVLLITHNLGVVTELCSRVVTMYCGQVVNDDQTRRLLIAPQHPYPWALLQASTVDVDDLSSWTGISGAPASPVRPPTGCRFHLRCPYAAPECSVQIPELTARDGGRTRCLRIDDLELKGVGV